MGIVKASFWKKKEAREIISGAFLRSQERLQSIQTLRNTILRAQEHFQSPSEHKIATFEVKITDFGEFSLKSLLIQQQ